MVLELDGLFKNAWSTRAAAEEAHGSIEKIRKERNRRREERSRKGETERGRANEVMEGRHKETGEPGKETDKREGRHREMQKKKKMGRQPYRRRRRCSSLIT